MTTSADVVVVGAGPTGLLLAGDLAASGISVRVLERRPEQTNNLTRAFAVHARTLEVLDARALADDLVTRGARVGELRLLRRLEIRLRGPPGRPAAPLPVPARHAAVRGGAPAGAAGPGARGADPARRRDDRAPAGRRGR